VYFFIDINFSDKEPVDIGEISLLANEIIHAVQNNNK